MISSSSLRYFSLSSSTKRRCLCRGSSCFLRASATRTFSSASVRFNRVRTESWFSSCTHAQTYSHTMLQIFCSYFSRACCTLKLVFKNYLSQSYVMLLLVLMLICCHCSTSIAAANGVSKETSVIYSNCTFPFPILERPLLMHNLLRLVMPKEHFPLSLTVYVFSSHCL